MVTSVLGQSRSGTRYLFALVSCRVFLDLRDGVVVVGNLEQTDFLGEASVLSLQLREELRGRVCQVPDLRRVLEGAIQPPLLVSEGRVVARQLVGTAEDRRAAGHLVCHDIVRTVNLVLVAAQETQRALAVDRVC